MPNHITSIITFDGPEEKVKELKNKVTTKESIFDFNRIIPMPEELIITNNSYTEFFSNREKYRLLDLAHIFRKECEKFKGTSFKSDAIAGLLNYLNYGYVSWYHWSIDNWGTKWNSYEIEYINDNQVTFQTAWNFPYPVIRKLSELYPELTIIAEYYDEDFGYNLGSCTFKEGILIDGGALEDDSQEGYALLWEICPYAEDYLEKIDGKFIRKYE